MTRPSSLHALPRRLPCPAAEHKTSESPPSRSVRQIFPSAVKATERPSREKTGKLAPMAPGARTTVVLASASRWTKSWFDWPRPLAAITIALPSRAMARDEPPPVVEVEITAGSWTVTRRTGPVTEDGTGPVAYQPAATSAAADAAPTATASHLGRVRTGAGAGTTVRRRDRASAMSRSRSFGSRARQCRSSCVTGPGTDCGTSVHSGSFFSTAASVSETVSPGTLARR